MPTTSKKIAVVASGWHFPAQFYEAVAKQKLPRGWKLDMFCIAHRDPEYAAKEKEGKVFDGDRADLDQKLYPSVITVEEMQQLGWNYKEYPNTVGDWGCSNQWLDEHNYKDYDLLLFTHDDNLVLTYNWFYTIIRDGNFKKWEVLANSLGMPEGWIRGSCEFFKPSFIEKIGGKFDLSRVTLSMEGKTSASEDIGELNDWNNTVHPLMEFITENKIPVGYLSPSYRVSMFVIEGERGYIGNTHGMNTERENAGIKHLRDNGII